MFSNFIMVIFSILALIKKKRSITRYDNRFGFIRGKENICKNKDTWAYAQKKLYKIIWIFFFLYLLGGILGFTNFYLAQKNIQIPFLINISKIFYYNGVAPFLFDNLFLISINAITYSLYSLKINKDLGKIDL